jgi:DNA-binding NarL/FixJ family response regulator
MDIRMRRVDGLSATRALAALDGPPPVLILTTFDDDDVLWGAIEAGAAGFMLKDAPAESLIAAATAVASGAAWMDAKVAPRVLTAFRAAAGPRRTGSRQIESLTERERTVLRLMASAATNAEIAGELCVSEATVKSHVGSLFAKLGARDRAAAIVFAYEHGLVHTDVAPPPG